MAHGPLARHKQVYKDDSNLSPKSEFEESNRDETSSNDEDNSSVEESSSDLFSDEDTSDDDDYRTYLQDELIQKLQVLLLSTLVVKYNLYIYR